MEHPIIVEMNKQKIWREKLNISDCLCRQAYQSMQRVLETRNFYEAPVVQGCTTILPSAKCELQIASKPTRLRPQSQSDVLKIAKDGIFKTW